MMYVAARKLVLCCNPGTPLAVPIIANYVTLSTAEQASKATINTVARNGRGRQLKAQVYSITNSYDMKDKGGCRVKLQPPGNFLRTDWPSDSMLRPSPSDK